MKNAPISFIVFILMGLCAHADKSSSNSENKLAEIRGICESRKKPADMCGCVVKNLHNKIRNGQFSDRQLGDAILAVKGSPDAADYMADLITGLEYHCMENSNYTAD